ncbi:MAG: 30S ribosomal protein S21 [Gammaproteobacteria bacterium GWF2_41_13]|nr:MAG: 30S ribosomal protein S21 [Gammaproteobacteria bacterium GWF2_41_13]
MPVVRIKENESFDTAMRRFKRICEKAGIISTVRQHEFYEKPKWRRKRQEAQAKKRLQKRLAKEVMAPARGVAKNQKERERVRR